MFDEIFTSTASTTICRIDGTTNTNSGIAIAGVPITWNLTDLAKRIVKTLGLSTRGASHYSLNSNNHERELFDIDYCDNAVDGAEEAEETTLPFSKKPRLLNPLDVLDSDQRRHRRRRHRHRGGDRTLSGKRRYGLIIASSAQQRADELFRSWSEPRREIVTFALSNRSLFTVGGPRSILHVYRSLLLIIYGRENYGQCVCYEREARYVHTTRDIATYPSKPHGDTVGRYSFQLAYRLTLNDIELIDDLSYPCDIVDDDHEETTRESPRRSEMRQYGIIVQSNNRAIVGTRADETHKRSVSASILDTESSLIRAEWFCNVQLVIPRGRGDGALFDDCENDGASLSSSRFHGRAVLEKLLDHRFASAAEAWTLLVGVMEWCDFVHREIGLYPARRSVWDLMFYAPGDGGCDDEAPIASSWRVVGINGLVDLGHIADYVYTLRVFLLTLYLGCSYGGIVRSVSANERASNRSHDCVFPPKTSGVYHALFHTSIVPHRLLCAQYGTRRGGHGARTVESDLATSHYDTPEEWLEDLCALRDKACDRYGIPRGSNDASSLI